MDKLLPMIRGQSVPLRLGLLSAEGKRSTRYREARVVVGYLLVIITMSLIGWLYLTQASQMTVSGYRIHKLEAEKALLERQNTQLRFQIAELEALPRIEARAKELGFAPVREATYLVVEDYPEETPLHAAEWAVTSEPEEAAVWEGRDDGAVDTMSWWKEVVSQFTAWVTASP